MIGIRAKKALGQHFLHDRNTAQRIVSSLSNVAATTLEIGPGAGALTGLLLQRPDITTYAVEIDPEAVAWLQQAFPALQGRLITGDFLSTPLHRYFSEPFSVIGNFPYNISSQIVFKILDYRQQIPEVVGMFQKEVAERLAGSAGRKTYGILSVLLQAYYDVDYLFTVDEQAFTPPPNVKSAVIRLRRNAVTQLRCDEALFLKIVKTTFNQRRKIIRNALKPLTGDTRLPDHRYFSMRPEQLQVAEFEELTRLVDALLRHKQA
jgi:16S rRNA (adenine1518-N6/adenine1519-N6)-dimethyltransferase